LRKDNNRFLNIKGAALDKEQLKSYMEKIAVNHDLSNISDIRTNPIPRVKDNFRFIEKTYNLLNEHIKLDIDIYPAGEWLLDNFYIIEETAKTVIREISPQKYKNFLGIKNNQYSGYARIYVLSAEIVAYTDSRITNDVLTLSILGYQKRRTLSMEEIWNLWIFLEIAIIENIRSICEKIYLAQIQKYKVESIVERLVEQKNKKELKFKKLNRDVLSFISYEEMKYPFIEYMSYKLKQYGKRGLPYLNVLEKQVSKMGMDISEVIKKEHFDIALGKVSLGNSITSMREILRVNFSDLFEKINGVEEILKKDPINVYRKMDYKTKDLYRNKIQKLEQESKISEIYIANKALDLAKENYEKTGEEEKLSNKKAHIGYFLVSDGISELRANLLDGTRVGVKNKKHKKKIYEKRARVYVTFVFSITTFSSLLFGMYMRYLGGSITLGIISSIFIYIPISEICIQAINYILSKKTEPMILPKLDLSSRDS